MPLIAQLGDLFAAEAQTLVNTVNAVGVMGKGVALEFKKRFPEMYKDYEARCRRGEVRMGEPYLFARPEAPWILNFPTKRHWRDVSRLDDIILGLEYLEAHYRDWGIRSLAVPPLGCGNGQLEWRVVGPTLAEHLDRLDIPVTLFAPFGTPQAQLSPGFLLGNRSKVQELPLMDAAWVALAAIVQRIEAERYHWPVGRTRFQKLAYFATVRGLPTGLVFGRASYGPFAAGLKQVTARLVNNGILHEEAAGQMTRVRPGRTYETAAAEYASDLANWEPIVRDVTDLFQRMDTRETEVAASALLVANEFVSRSEGYSERDVVDAVLAWKVRREPPIDEAQLASTTRALNMLGWIQAEFSDDLPVDDGL